MTKDDFTNTAYSYFPKGIDAISQYDAYMNSPEFGKLSNHCSLFYDREETGEFDGFYESVRLLDVSKNFHIVNLFHLGDRAFNLQLAETKGTKHYYICLNVSIIGPYYLIYVLELDISHALVEPVDFLRPGYKPPARNIEMEDHYASLLQKMGNVAESTFNVKPFPQNLLHTVLPDLTLETIRSGNFTFFNAFFLDDYQYRL